MHARAHSTLWCSIVTSCHNTWQCAATSPHANGTTCSSAVCCSWVSKDISHKASPHHLICCNAHAASAVARQPLCATVMIRPQTQGRLTLPWVITPWQQGLHTTAPSISLMAATRASCQHSCVMAWLSQTSPSFCLLPTSGLLAAFSTTGVSSTGQRHWCTYSVTSCCMHLKYYSNTVLAGHLLLISDETSQMW